MVYFAPGFSLKKTRSKCLAAKQKGRATGLFGMKTVKTVKVPLEALATHINVGVNESGRTQQLPSRFTHINVGVNESCPAVAVAPHEENSPGCLLFEKNECFITL